jgi:hypothetical protein
MSPKKENASDKKDQNLSGGKGKRLPILWETVNTFSKIIVTLLGVAVAGISYYSGCGFLMSAIRAGASMLVVGIILWLIYWLIVKGSLSMMNDLIRKQGELQSQNNNGSMEFKV